MKEEAASYRILTLNTVAFTVCFAAWMLNGVLVTFLVENGLFEWDAAQMGTLIGIPVLTGSLMRLPVGMLTDKFGGRPVYTLLMLFSAIPMFYLSRVDSYTGYMIASLGFGMTGTSFAVGIAFSSVWFHREHQGTALGIFGAGNAGAGLTVLGAPVLLRSLTDGGQNLEGWRTLPVYYAVMLVLMAVVFFIGTTNKKPEHAAERTILQMLRPLKNIRVWRFGLYYFLVFGGLLDEHCDRRAADVDIFASFRAHPSRGRVHVRQAGPAHRHVLDSRNYRSMQLCSVFPQDGNRISRTRRHGAKERHRDFGDRVRNPGGR